MGQSDDAAADASDANTLAALIRARRSVRDFLSTPIPEPVLDAVLADACWSPSWSNTQPYRVAVATGELRDILAAELCDLFDRGMAARNGGLLGRIKLMFTRRGLPDGDFSTRFAYPDELQPRRRDTGHGLYSLLGIDRKDSGARERQMRRNFAFFGAPAVLFLFVHRGLREFSALDAGIYLQTLMLSAQARGLATCAQGALATWAGPVRAAFEFPPAYRLICGVSIGYASDHAVNDYNPGRADERELRLTIRRGAAENPLVAHRGK